MKKICFVCMNINSAGGAEKVAKVLANELCRDYEVHMIGLHRIPDAPKEEFDPAVKVHAIVPDRRFARIRNTYKSCRKEYRKILKEHRFDYIALIGQYPAFLGTVMGLFLKGKRIFCDHGSVEYYLKDLSQGFICWFNTLMAKKTVVLTDRSKTAYSKRLHFKESKIVRIYNWIPEENFCANEYDVTSKRIISAGRITAIKGFDLVPAIAKKVFSKHPDWSWDIYGNGDLFDTIDQKIKDAGLANNVFLKGNVKNLEQLYRDYAMYVMTSTMEGLPLVLLEAKSKHIPIVSFDVPTGPSDIVRDGVDGYIVTMKDIDALSDRMIKLIEDDKLRVGFSAAAYDNIEKFNKTRILGEWKEVFS